MGLSRADNFEFTAFHRQLWSPCPIDGTKQIERMYYVIGADQREYGPVSAETVRAWIAQGRLNARSLARTDQTVGWRPLSDFPEFPEAIAQTAAPVYPSAAVGQPPRTENNMALASLVLG